MDELRILLSQIFISPSEPRLRAGWRIAAHAVIYNILLICLTSVVLVPVITLKIPPDNMLLNSTLATFAATPSVFLARRFIDRRPIASLGLQLNWQALSDLFIGIGVAGLVMGFIFLAEYVLGWITFENFAWQTETPVYMAGQVSLVLLVCLLVGWYEELLFRGYRLQNLADGLNTSWAVIISSAWFGAAHLLNPSANWISTTGIFLAGIFLAYPYLRTKQLWMSIGLHIGWNFFEGPVFGFPVSGLNFFRLTRITIHGPKIWTGGAFGPEAGLIVVPGLILGTILIYIFTINRKP